MTEARLAKRELELLHRARSSGRLAVCLKLKMIVNFGRGEERRAKSEEQRAKSKESRLVDYVLALRALLFAVRLL